MVVMVWLWLWWWWWWWSIGSNQKDYSMVSERADQDRGAHRVRQRRQQGRLILIILKLFASQGLWFVILVYDLNMHQLQSLICDHGLVDWHKIFPVGTRSIQDQEGWELHWIFQGWHIPLIFFFLTENKIFVAGWKGQVLHKSGGGAALRLRVEGSPTARGSTGENIKLMSYPNLETAHPDYDED